MLNLSTIFFRKFTLILITLFLVLVIFFYFILKNLIQEQTKTNMLHNIIIVSSVINNFDNIDQKIKELKNNFGFRITIIDKNGIVLAETDKDKNLLENHINRDEIIQAKSKEFGYAIRYSNTFKKDFLYVAKQFVLNGEPYYIRMAKNLNDTNREFLSIGYKTFLIFLIFLVIALFASFKIGKDIEYEIKSILLFLKDLAKQKKEQKIESTYSIEFDKITKLLSSVSESLSKKNKQKSKYTARLKLSNRQKDDIISAISHEFRNPIAVISGYTQTLLTDKDINQNIRDRFLEKIKTNANKMSTMIDRLRLSIRLDDGEIETKIKSVSLKTLILNQIDDLKSAYPNREIFFEGEDITKEIDETIFGVAVINLIENALKYSKDKVSVTLDHEKIIVKDYGIGINQKEIENITKKFYRVSANGWNNSLGVGLSLVQNILNAHHFKLEIQSIENEGSAFSIVFNN